MEPFSVLIKMQHFFLEKQGTLILYYTSNVLFIKGWRTWARSPVYIYKAVCRLCQPSSAQESIRYKCVVPSQAGVSRSRHGMGLSNHPVPVVQPWCVVRFTASACSRRSIGTGRQPGRGQEGSASSPVRPLVSARCRTEPPQGQGRQRDKPGRSPTQSTETHARR
jgi:hypothetical protein